MKKMIYSIINNIKAAYCELVYNVSWPTKQELSNSTIIVTITSLIMALMVLVIDFSFENVISFFYKNIK